MVVIISKDSKFSPMWKRMRNMRAQTVFHITVQILLKKKKKDIATTDIDKSVKPLKP